MMNLPPRQRLRVTSDFIVEEEEEDVVYVKNSFLHVSSSNQKRKQQKRRCQSCPPIKFVAMTSFTTVMVRNIPTRFTSISFLRLLDDAGFAGTYGFFYIPVCSFFCI
jgi:hypothetical protein